MCVFMVLDCHLFNDTSVVQGERRAELARDLLSRSPHSQHILYVLQSYKIISIYTKI